MTRSRRRPRAPIGVLVTAAALAAIVIAAAVQLRRAPRGAPGPRAPGTTAPRLDPFRTIVPDTVPVAWRPWAAATFALARTRGVPIAALVDATWSESCVLYAAAVAADAAAHAALDRLVAVRVDADRRPDVFERYCPATLPAWVLLAPDGRVVQVLDALPPAPLARRLAALRSEPAPARSDPGLDVLRAQVPVPPPGGDAAGLAAAVFAALRAEWPAADAPIADDAPFLDGDALDLLSVRARFGDAEARALYDDALRRVAARADFAGAIEQEVLPAPDRVHRARFLATQAVWLVHWQHAAAAGGVTPIVVAAAARARAGLDSTFWDAERGLFRAVQGTLVLHRGRPALTGSERARMAGSGHAALPAPHVVEVYPVAGNARAATALLESPVGAPDVAARRDRAARVLDRLRRTWRDAGRVPHDFAPDARGGLRAGDCEWMGDVAELGRALLAAWRVAPPGGKRDALRDDATEVGTLLLERFADPASGLLLDVPDPAPDAPERLRVRLAPLADGGRAALFLCELAAATGDARWSQAARRTVLAWTRAVRGHGAFAAAPLAAAATLLGELP